MNGIQMQNDKLIVNNPSLNAKQKHHSQTTRWWNWLQKMEEWLLRRQHREKLLRMPDYLLKDIGLTREDVLAESKVPFWKSGIY